MKPVHRVGRDRVFPSEEAREMKTKLLVVLMLAGSSLFAGPHVFIGFGVAPAPVAVYAPPPAPLASASSKPSKIKTRMARRVSTCDSPVSMQASAIVVGDWIHDRT